MEKGGFKILQLKVIEEEADVGQDKKILHVGLRYDCSSNCAICLINEISI